MKKSFYILMLLLLALTVSCQTATQVPPTAVPATEVPAVEEPAAPTEAAVEPTAEVAAEAETAPVAEAETAAEPVALEGEIVFGVTAPLTGENKMVGDYIKNGAELAANEINEAGGILGKKLVLVFEDEVNNQQSSVNAMTKLMERDELMGFFGSTYSSYCIAVSPVVQEKKITMFAGGSSANIPKQGNPYIWQVRMTDDQSGKLLAKAAVENLKMKNPAIMYSTESFGTGLKDQTVAALAALGVTVEESKIIGFPVEEKNYTSIISNIQNSDADGLIGITHQLPSALISQQVAAAGLEIPLLGSSSWASAVCRENAKGDADGWYAVADWTVEVTTPEGKHFAEAYKNTYNMDSDMPAVAVYDSIHVFKKACEIAGTTTDREAINNALKEIKGLPGAMSTYSYSENHCFSTSQFLTINKDQKAVMIDTIKKSEN